MSIADDLKRAADIIAATLPLSEGELSSRLRAHSATVAAMEADAGRWAFFRKHAYDDLDGMRLHHWLVINHFREGGWDKAIDYCMRIRDAALAHKPAGGEE